MAFGLNRVELIGRLGADVTVNQLMSGGRVANLSIATDESYINQVSCFMMHLVGTVRSSRQI